MSFKYFVLPPFRCEELFPRSLISLSPFSLLNIQLIDVDKDKNINLCYQFLLLQLFEIVETAVLKYCLGTLIEL